MTTFFEFPQLRLMTVLCFGATLSFASISFSFDKELKLAFPNYFDLFEARLMDFIKALVEALGDTKLLGKAMELLRLFN